MADFFGDNISDLKKYINPIENKNKYRLFESECQRFAELAKKYENMSCFLDNQCKENVVREEYGVKGEMLDRGFYTTNPVCDIVFGNCNRGKILRKITRRSNISFTYGFDVSDKLLIINSWIDGRISTSEYLIYCDNTTVLGITFSSDHLVTQLCEEIYDNAKIQSIKKTNFVLGTNLIYSLDNDIFTYDEFGIRSYDFYSYDSQTPHIQHLQFLFKHDSDGYLSEYTVTDYNSIVTTELQHRSHIISDKNRVKR